MIGDATNWDEDAYRENIIKEREAQTLTVFRTAWAPSLNPDPDILVAATSDGSLASYSIPSCISKLASEVGDAGVQDGEPEGVLRAHDGPAYDVKFYGDSKDALLLSCGDDGWIRGWQWKEFAASEVHISLQGEHLKPVLDLVNPQHKGPWGALSPMPENNAIAVDTQSGSIFSAAGDSCAYCWDVETCKIKMVFKGHLDYLHCLVTRCSTNQIITGSEDGTVRIWDCKSGKCIKVMSSERDKKLRGFSSNVSSIALDASESWLAVSNCQSLSVWNLPASACVSTTSTRAPIQDVLFDNSQIVAVGAEPLVRHFDINSACLSQIPCAPCSAFSVSLHPSGVTAVGGYGGLVDIISQFGSHYCVLRCNS